MSILRSILICTLITALLLPIVLVSFYFSKVHLGVDIKFYHFVYLFMMGVIFLGIFPFMPYLAFTRFRSRLKATPKEKKILFAYGIIMGILMFLFFFDPQRIAYLLSFFTDWRGKVRWYFWVVVLLLGGFICFLALMFYDRIKHKTWNKPQHLSEDEEQRYDRAKTLIVQVIFCVILFFLVGSGTAIIMLKQF